MPLAFVFATGATTKILSPGVAVPVVMTSSRYRHAVSQSQWKMVPGTTWGHGACRGPQYLTLEFHLATQDDQEAGLCWSPPVIFKLRERRSKKNNVPVGILGISWDFLNFPHSWAFFCVYNP